LTDILKFNQASFDIGAIKAQADFILAYVDPIDADNEAKHWLLVR
jgi:hypothetical protein